MTDAADRLLGLLRAEAGLRTFGVSDVRKAAWIRHGYLLALEEARRALEYSPAAQTASSPRHGR